MVFPNFFSLSVNFTIKISWSESWSTPSLVYADLYRASQSFNPKNAINLILLLTIWWHPCHQNRLLFCYKRMFAMTKHSLSKTLLDFALLHFVLKGQAIYLTHDSLLFHSSPIWWKGHIFLDISSTRSCRSS